MGAFCIKVLHLSHHSCFVARVVLHAIRSLVLLGYALDKLFVKNRVVKVIIDRFLLLFFHNLVYGEKPIATHILEKPVFLLGRCQLLLLLLNSHLLHLLLRI